MTVRYVGFNPPFIGGPQKVMSSQADDRLIRNDVLQNLLILPGELPFRPNFGVNLRNFVFEKNTANDLNRLENDIRTQLVSNDERLLIKFLNLTSLPDQSAVEITLIVALKEDPDRNIEIKRLIQVLTRN